MARFGTKYESQTAFSKRDRGAFATVTLHPHPVAHASISRGPPNRLSCFIRCMYPCQYVSPGGSCSFSFPACHLSSALVTTFSRTLLASSWQSCPPSITLHKLPRDTVPSPPILCTTTPPLILSRAPSIVFSLHTQAHTFRLCCASMSPSALAVSHAVSWLQVEVLLLSLPASSVRFIVCPLCTF